MFFFLKKYLVPLFRISFCELLWILIVNILKMLEQLCHVKNAWYDVLKFMIAKICCITSEEKTRVFKV